MDNTYWLKQTDKPLFEDVLWSRPENKRLAGKLLIVGGNLHGFTTPANAYLAALKAGIGTLRVVLPAALQKTVGKMIPEAEFAPSTPSGGFARQALDVVLENAKWADGVLLAGDFGKNSETAIMLESFAKKYEGQLNFAGDSMDYFLNPNSIILVRYNNVITCDISQLQRLAKNNRPGTPILHSMNLHELVTVLADWTNGTPASFITKHADNFMIASSGKVSTTPSRKDNNWQTDLAAYASVWWLQQPDKIFETITTAIFEYSK